MLILCSSLWRAPPSGGRNLGSPEGVLDRRPILALMLTVRWTCLLGRHTWAHFLCLFGVEPLFAGFDGDVFFRSSGRFHLYYIGVLLWLTALTATLEADASLLRLSHMPEVDDRM